MMEMMIMFMIMIMITIMMIIGKCILMTKRMRWQIRVMIGMNMKWKARTKIRR